MATIAKGPVKTKPADNLEELKTTLRRWQEIEQESIAQTSAIIGKTHNPLIQLVMEIIRQDSAMHKRVQQAILDSVEKQAFSLTPEELGEVWDLIVTSARSAPRRVLAAISK